MAERVGFVPDDPPHVNDLGRFRNAQSSQNSRNLNIRYKTGPPKSPIQSRRTTILCHGSRTGCTRKQVTNAVTLASAASRPLLLRLDSNQQPSGEQPEKTWLAALCGGMPRM